MSTWLKPASPTDLEALHNYLRWGPLLGLVLMALVAMTHSVISPAALVLLTITVVSTWTLASPKVSSKTFLVMLGLIAVSSPASAVALGAIPMILIARTAILMTFTTHRTVIGKIKADGEHRNGLDGESVPTLRAAAVEHRPAAASGFGQQRDTGSGSDDDDGDGDGEHVHPINLRNGQHRQLRTFSRVGFLELGLQAGGARP